MTTERRIPTLVALLLSAILAACSGQGASAPPSAGQASLMSRLALEGDGVFDARYVSRVGTDGVLFVGTKAGEAVAYLCDPAAGSRWFSGTSQDGRLDLSDAKGGHLAGPATATTFDATISGIAGYDGTVSLPAAPPGARLVREPGVPSGQLVGGLVFDGDVIRGVFTVKVSGTVKTGTASIPAGTPIAIGVQSTVGPRVDLTISTKPKLSDETQAAAGKAIRAAEAKIKGEKVAAELQLVLAIACALVMIAAATDGVDSSVANAVVAAAMAGSVADADPTVNGFLTTALKDIVAGLRLSIETPRPSGTAAPQPVTLGTLTFGSFSGSL